LAGRSSLEIAIAQVQQSSRRYAKRQLTWFRRNENMRWIIRKQDQVSAEILAAARQLIWNFDN
jgi:tRNA dimethylallyltransferase